MKLLLMSDIHGNLSALQSVLAQAARERLDACVLLGDLIDYNPHSNEVISLVKQLPYPILCSIRGNHEDAVIRQDYSRFSSDRGRASARHTRTQLNEGSWDYIDHTMLGSGKYAFCLEGRKYLAIHGSLQDEYWKAIRPGQDLGGYRDYDLVLSGHSHIPHCFAEYYDADAPAYRNKKKTIFINPGSIGQPRNHNPMAQFAILDTMTDEVILKKVPYDIQREQRAFTDAVDVFYKERLGRGI